MDYMFFTHPPHPKTSNGSTTVHIQIIISAEDFSTSKQLVWCFGQFYICLI